MQDKINKIEEDWSRKLRDQQEWFRVTLSSVGDAVIATDTSCNVTFMNPVAEQITGFKEAEALGRPIRDVFNIFNEISLAPAEISVDLVLRDGVVRGLANHTALVTKNGDARSIADSAAPIRSDDGTIVGVVMVFRDITESKRLEEQIARLDKLNAVGQMAAGIAHEIRNPMTTVRGFLQLLFINQDFADYKDYFHTMISELDRANGIISGFLSLAKDSLIEIKAQHLNAIIEQIAPLLQAEAVINTKLIELDLAAIPTLLLSENDIRQLILNLVRNAIEASPEGQKITIRTYQQNDRVILEVQDRGNGIEDKILPNLGTPFVSNKSNGTGLGIYSCYQIAQRHNADLDFKTGPTGTTIAVSFPL